MTIFVVFEKSKKKWSKEVKLEAFVFLHGQDKYRGFCNDNKKLNFGQVQSVKTK